jgi:hypothetical protein
MNSPRRPAPALFDAEGRPTDEYRRRAAEEFQRLAKTLGYRDLFADVELPPKWRAR